MNKEERYDFVIIGAGPNGTALGAYLAKSGQSVCLLEERPEAGGGCENAYPMAGVRIDPHTTYMYAGAAPEPFHPLGSSSQPLAAKLSTGAFEAILP